MMEANEMDRPLVTLDVGEDVAACWGPCNSLARCDALRVKSWRIKSVAQFIEELSALTTIVMMSGDYAVPNALPLVVGVPLIAWARVRLRRHTVTQTIAGALLGLTISLLVL